MSYGMSNFWAFRTLIVFYLRYLFYILKINEWYMVHYLTPGGAVHICL